MTSPLARLVRAHSPSRSALVSRAAVSTTCARESVGAAQATTTHIDAIRLTVLVMARLYPRRVDSEPLHPPIEIWPVGLESARGVGDVTARLRQRSRDHRALEAVQFFRKRCRSARDGFTSSSHAFLSTGRRDRHLYFFLTIDDEYVFDLRTAD